MTKFKKLDHKTKATQLGGWGFGVALGIISLFQTVGTLIPFIVDILKTDPKPLNPNEENDKFLQSNAYQKISELQNGQSYFFL